MPRAVGPERSFTTQPILDFIRRAPEHRRRVRVQLGKKIGFLTFEELRAREAGHREVLVDVGTGDGAFVYRHAREDPSCLCIGIDPVGERMSEYSGRALKKPSRGGLTNVLYVVAAVEDLPPELAGIASLITLNFPWGSLLLGVTAPDDAVLRAIRNLAKTPAHFSILLNASVYADEDYCRRHGIPIVDREKILEELTPCYRDAGLAIESVERISGEPPHHTRWGSRLVKGSARETLIVEGQIR